MDSAKGDPLLVRDAEGSLLSGVSCRDCGHVSFPARPVCPSCLGTGVQDAAIGARATLLMHTVSHVAPDGFEAPLVQAWVALDEGPELFSLLLCTAGEASKLRVGQKLKLVVLFEGTRRERWGYKPVGREAG